MPDATSSAETVARIRAWLASPEGKEKMREAMERARQSTAHLTPGTPEYYETQEANRKALKRWNDGPFI